MSILTLIEFPVTVMLKHLCLKHKNARLWESFHPKRKCQSMGLLTLYVWAGIHWQGKRHPVGSPIGSWLGLQQGRNLWSVEVVGVVRPHRLHEIYENRVSYLCCFQLINSFAFLLTFRGLVCTDLK